VKKQFRLKKTQDFQRDIKKGNFVKNTSFVIHYISNELNKLRIGISVPKKTGVAVVRNKIKRQIKAMLQTHLINLEKIDYVIIVRHQYNINEFYKSREALISLLNKIGDHDFEKKN
jgi:ribonuclease P protein component